MQDNKNMTASEAKEAMLQGHKISHLAYTDDEYMRMKDGIEVFEDDIQVPKEFWKYPYTKDGWFIKS